MDNKLISLKFELLFDVEKDLFDMVYGIPTHTNEHLDKLKELVQNKLNNSDQCDWKVTIDKDSNINEIIGTLEKGGDWFYLKENIFGYEYFYYKPSLKTRKLFGDKIIDIQHETIEGASDYGYTKIDYVDEFRNVNEVEMKKITNLFLTKGNERLEETFDDHITPQIKNVNEKTITIGDNKTNVDFLESDLIKLKIDEIKGLLGDLKNKST